jgi:hypothetical protein
MLTSSESLVAGITLLSLAVLWRLWKIQRAFGAFSHLPAHWSLLSPVYPLGRTLPRIPWVSPGSTFGWQAVYEC